MSRSIHPYRQCRSWTPVINRAGKRLPGAAQRPDRRRRWAGGLKIYCRCGRCAEFMQGLLQRKYRVPSRTLVMDLQYRMRCKNCRAIRGFKITLYDERERGSNSPQNERVIVEGDLPSHA